MASTVRAVSARSDLASLDEGTRHRIQLLVALFREATNRNNDLQKIIRRNVTLDENGQPKLIASTLASDLETKSEVARWLDSSKTALRRSILRNLVSEGVAEPVRER